MNTDNYQQFISELQELFGHYNPAECKDKLWKLFALAVSGGFSHQPVKRREDLLAFYEHVQQLFNVLELLETELKRDRERVSVKALQKSF